MARYEIRIQKSGGARTIFLHAANEDTARRLAQRQGKLVTIKKRASLDFLPAMTTNERAIFLYRMSTMLTSRVPVTNALNTMISSFVGEIRTASKRLKQRLDQGFSLIEAIEQDPRNFPATTTALIRAGISSGNTGQALKQAAEFEAELNSVKSASLIRIWQALVAFYTAGAVLIGSTYWVSPMVTNNPIFRQTGKFDFRWTHTLGVDSIIVLGAILAALTGLIILASAGRGAMPLLAERIISKIPIYRDLVMAPGIRSAMHRLALLAQQGIPVESALKLVAADTPRGLLRKNFDDALKAIHKGLGWANSLTLLHPTDRAALTTSVNKSDTARSLASIAENAAKVHIKMIALFGPTLSTIAAVSVITAIIIAFVQTVIPAMDLMSAIASQ